MPKFVSRLNFAAAAIYPGAVAQTQRGQMWDSLNAGGVITDVARAAVTATGALVTTQCGPLLVDAAAGNMVLTLPASGVATDEAVYDVHRTDATTNTVTFAPNGADTIDGATTVAAGGTLRLRLPAGSTVWRVSGIGGATAPAARKAIGAENLAQDFRLSLTTNTPVPTADVVGGATLYFTPHKGQYIDLFDGTNWVRLKSAQISLALAGLTAGRPYDVFVYSNAGVPALEVLAWTNDTTRATALAYQDGVPCKTGALTRLYVGSLYTTGVTTTEDSAAKRYLWNYYNRVSRLLQRLESTASWTQATTATWRQANASAANQVGFLIGVAGDIVKADLNAMFTPNNGYKNAAALGLNSTTVPTGLYAPSGNSSSSSVTEMPLRAKYMGTPAIGLNYLAWLEWMQSNAFNTTWYGQNNTATYQTQCGIAGEVLA